MDPARGATTPILRTGKSVIPDELGWQFHVLTVLSLMTHHRNGFDEQVPRERCNPMCNRFRLIIAGILFSCMVTTQVHSAWALTPPSEPKPVVAVFEIKTRNISLPQSTIGVLSSYLGSRLTACGKYSVAPGSSIREAMSHLKIDSQRDCYDDACRIELGRAAAAHKYLNTLVWKVDKIGRASCRERV